MASILSQCGIDIPSEQLPFLWAYHELIRRYNPELNLTRIHEFESMVVKLYADSILAGIYFNLPSPLLDLGSGPGMPGIPLGILFPEIKIILSESRKNRVDFLQQAVTELGLKNVSVLGGAITKKTEIPVENIITRAVETISKTLERVEGCLEKYGIAIFMKGPNCDREIEDAKDRFKGKYLLEENISYTIPATSHKRRLVVFKRLGISTGRIRISAMARHRCKEIKSDQNPVFKGFKKLFTTRGIRRAQQTIVSGKRIVHEITSNFPNICRAWISDESHSLPPEDLSYETSWFRLSSPLFSKLDRFGTGFPLLAVDVPKISPWLPEHGLPPGCSLMIPFQDPENVGAAVRSAVAFNVDRIILLAESANPFHPKAIRASAGAVFCTTFFSGPSINDLSPTLPIIGLSSRGQDIKNFTFPETIAILPGIEGPGLPKHLEKNAISIPIDGRVESLNAATAMAIALFLRAAAAENLKPTRD
ncbi:MAG: 16S rRNA (guanine(527)-N(7))-methyltransferase RsmG [Deltaproteobacteria bacterium]|nr:16S rRNA (guanine(527)-N(7))-methyltransferase RsmG [Deltaproteobacteria bacterium]